MDDKSVLRARDFWTSIVLICVSLFFIYRTTLIPFFNSSAAGVSGEWYDSAALVPFGIFAGLLTLGISLLIIAIRDGGSAHALSAVGLGFSQAEAIRLGCISLILFFFIFGLVPRVDFIIGSALLITALIWGFHGSDRVAMIYSTLAVVSAGLYALIMHLPQSEWGRFHDDDWVALACFAILVGVMWLRTGRMNTRDRIVRATPIVAVMTPLLLILAMAFGFRQNVPNRQGLIFSQIEYNYYVNLRPLWRD